MKYFLIAGCITAGLAIIGMKYSFTVVCIVAGLGILFVLKSSKDKNSLMTELGPPPPWPIFIAVHILAGILRSIADKLTPTQITMLTDFGFSYHKLALAYVVQKYKIPDFVGDGGPKTVEQIAEHTKTKNVDRIERLMYACASMGMFRLVREKTFVNTGLSAVLRRDHPNSMAGWIGFHYEECYHCFGHLHEMFGPNSSDVVAWNLEHPDFPIDHLGSKKGLWDLLEKYPLREEQFTRAMNAIEGCGGIAMVADGPFEKHSRFIDLGGSRGHLLTKVLNMYSKNEGMPTTGILFERAPVIKIASEVFDPELIKQNRITFHVGDFFDKKTFPDLHDGDCLIMRYILHDWNDKDAKSILRTIRSASKDKKVTLLIGESAMPNRTSVGKPAAIHNMDMQMMALVGGIERYPMYWEKLLNETGFKLVNVHFTRSVIAWMEAIPE